MGTPSEHRERHCSTKHGVVKIKQRTDCGGVICLRLLAGVCVHGSRRYGLVARMLLLAVSLASGATPQLPQPPPPPAPPLRRCPYTRVVVLYAAFFLAASSSLCLSVATV